MSDETPEGMFDPGNPQSVQRRESKVRAAQRVADNAVRAVMGTLEGRAVLWGVLSRAGLFRISHTPGGSHADCAFAEGQRNVGLPLFNDINRLCPDLYAVMAKEAHEDPHG